MSLQLDETHKELGSSVLQMKGVVLDAEKHIYKIQHNVYSP